MQAITQRFGPSHLAFLVVPMVGAFFIDIINAVVIKLFLALPLPVIPDAGPDAKPTLRWALSFLLASSTESPSFMGARWETSKQSPALGRVGLCHGGLDRRVSELTGGWSTPAGSGLRPDLPYKIKVDTCWFRLVARP